MKINIMHYKALTRAKAFAALICISTAVTAVADTIPSAPVMNLNIDSCRNMALRNNKTIRMADQAITGAGYLRKSAAAAYLPSLDFAMSYVYNQRDINLLGADAKLPTMTFDPHTQSYQYNILIDQLTGKPVINPETGSVIPTEVAVIPKEAMSYNTHQLIGGAVTLTQPVFMGGEIRAMNEITHYAEELARSQRNSTIQDVIYAVDEAYWQVVSLGEKQRLADSYLSLMDTMMHNVNAMYQQGVATRSDILTVQVRANEAEIAKTKVANGLSLSRMALAQLCGLPIHTQMTLADQQLVCSANNATYPLPDMADVYRDRQDLLSLRHSISIFEQKEKVALAQMLPKLAIVGMYAFSNPNTNNGFHRSFGGGFSIGATLTVPLWHWGGNYNKYKAAQVETNIQRLLLADAYEKVDLQVNQARFKYDEALRTYTMTQKNMEKADENLRQARLAFKEGMMTVNDVMIAHTAWLKAHSEYIDAEISIQLCKVYLQKVLGRMPY